MSSVVPDRVSQIRDEMEAVRAELAQTFADLGETPHWVRMGDPERFRKKADVTRGRAAEKLRHRAGELEHRLDLLETELDDVDTLPSDFPTNSFYGVVLPMRLETRFKKPGPGQPNWRLMVRVEPDPIAMPTPPAPSTRREAALVERCWNAAKGDLSTDEGARAFNDLAGRVGPPRAAWLLRSVLVDRRPGGGFEAVGDRPAKVPVPPPLVGLPPRLEIWGGSEGDLRRLLELRPDRRKIAAQSGLAGIKPRPDRSLPRTWWTSFEKAKEVGLAGIVPLGPQRPTGFDLLMCVGLAPRNTRPSPRDVFVAHINAGRLGTLRPLSPTNTVDGQPAADTRHDPESWLSMARLPKTTAGGLSSALTGSPYFTGVLEPDLRRHQAASTLVRALWPVLWQRSLKDLAGLGEDVYRLGAYAGRYLHPFGPLPTLRIGDLPYGVLPIADYALMEERLEPNAPLERAVLRAAQRLSSAMVDNLPPTTTVVGADEDAILQVLGRVPTSRAYGSRHYPATVLMAALAAALGGSSPTETVAQWERQAGPVLELIQSEVPRRHSPAFHVQPWPLKVAETLNELLARFLEVNWESLIHLDDLDGAWRLGSDLPPHPLARLVRHSLLLTMVELGRIGIGELGVREPTYLLPLTDPDQMASDAQVADSGQPVGEVPTVVRDLFGVDPGPVPRRDAVVRQYEDVRAAVRELVDTDRSDIDSVLTAVLDSAGHRVDVWQTATAHRRLRQLQSFAFQPVLGAYGWVDDLRPSDDPTPPTTAGLLHAPSHAQAVTAAVLRDQAVRNPGDDRWRLVLDSTTVRRAAELADQVRSGIHLSEVLGREIERRFPKPERVLALRRQFPARPEWAGRRVCDGQLILDKLRKDPTKLPTWMRSDRKQLDELVEALDAYADLLVADALHAVSEGRAEAASDALEASAGLAAPPELRLLTTQREGATIRTEVLFAIPWREDWEKTAVTASSSPVAVADPAVARWLTAELGSPSGVEWVDLDLPSRKVTLGALKLTIADLLLYSADELDELARTRLRGASRVGGNARGVWAQARRLCAVLGAADPEGPGVEKLVRERLTRLRTMAKDLDRMLGTPPAAGPQQRTLQERLWRWGLPAGAAEAKAELAARLADAGTRDGQARAPELARRIRVLVPTRVALPLVCPAQLPQLFKHPAVLTDWLPVLAAVRPQMAVLEAAQLLTEKTWAAATSDRSNDPWVSPAADSAGVATDMRIQFAIGPGVSSRGRAGVVRLDSWGETVPAPRHTTWTAFGYDAPRARAPQAVLVVVPADNQQVLDLAQVRGAVLQARRLARVRSLSGAIPESLAAALPLGVVEAVGETTAVRLVEEGV
jgi:hypothetical protein